jgi:hypothetical protein
MMAAVEEEEEEDCRVAAAAEEEEEGLPFQWKCSAAEVWAEALVAVFHAFLI